MTRKPFMPVVRGMSRKHVYYQLLSISAETKTDKASKVALHDVPNTLTTAAIKEGTAICSKS